MLQAMMQQNVLLYAMGILSFLGAASQIWLWKVYGRMTKDMENEREAKGKFVRQIRQRYGLLKRMGNGAVNTEIFIKRSLHQYHHLGSSLHQWRRMGVWTLALGLGAGCAGYYFSGTTYRFLEMRQDYLWAMAISAAFTACIYLATDIRYKRSYLETGLLDMLENDGPALPVQKETEAEKETLAPLGKLSLRKGKKPGQVNKAEQEKKELKENLSRIKASMGESAAGIEREKERNTEILKNMDPEEQERIIREVLKEFLS